MRVRRRYSATERAQRIYHRRIGLIIHTYIRASVLIHKYIQVISTLSSPIHYIREFHECVSSYPSRALRFRSLPRLSLKNYVTFYFCLPLRFFSFFFLIHFVFYRIQRVRIFLDSPRHPATIVHPFASFKSRKRKRRSRSWQFSGYTMYMSAAAAVSRLKSYLSDESVT